MNTDNLLRLADFLENVLPKEKFYYGQVVKGHDMPRKTFDCGSVACAVGWCPVAFPEHFTYAIKDGDDDQQEVQVFAMRDGRIQGSEIEMFLYMNNPEIEEFFGLSDEEALGLFYPRQQYRIGLPSLGRDASAKDVAATIRSFVETKQAAWTTSPR